MDPKGTVAAAKRTWSTDAALLGLDRRRASDVFGRLRVAYSTPGRHYHTLGHALAVVRGVERERARLRNRAAVRLAAWFHDAVYDPHRTDNEARSAEFARRVLGEAGVAPRTVREACRLVLLTRAHSCRAGDRDAEALLDADLSILGAGRRRYRGYARAVRREYAWATDSAFDAARLRVLRDLLARTSLFRSPRARAHREARARRNLRDECSRLEVDE